MHTFRNVLGIHGLTILKFPYQWTPLHLAATSGHVDIARLHVDKGANINGIDNGEVNESVVLAVD